MLVAVELLLDDVSKLPVVMARVVPEGLVFKSRVTVAELVVKEKPVTSGNTESV